MKYSILLAAIIFTGMFFVAGETQATSSEADNEVLVFVGQRLVPIPKLSCKSAAEAILRAESKNPGWKAVRVTETKIAWNVTLKKK